MSVVGTYKVSADTPIGRRTFEISVFEGGDGHSGILKTEERTYELDKVKVNENNFTFQVNLKLPMGDVYATFDCNVHEDMISGEVITAFATVDIRGQKI
ncbi:MAG: hypothetical protein FWC32_09535 [Firmicutes bacterium]|nr:hypothetical protein [Bacillota bacterium]